MYASLAYLFYLHHSRTSANSNHRRRHACTHYDEYLNVNVKAEEKVNYTILFEVYPMKFVVLITISNVRYGSCMYVDARQV